MNLEKALEIVSNCLNSANLKGVYNLNESFAIVTAINTISFIKEDYKKLKQLENSCEDKPTGKLATFSPEPNLKKLENNNK